MKSFGHRRTRKWNRPTVYDDDWLSRVNHPRQHTYHHQHIHYTSWAHTDIHCFIHISYHWHHVCYCFVFLLIITVCMYSTHNSSYIYHIIDLICAIVSCSSSSSVSDSMNVYYTLISVSFYKFYAFTLTASGISLSFLHLVIIVISLLCV